MAASAPLGPTPNQTCELCHLVIPTIYCTCTGTNVYLCDNCMVPHRLKNPMMVHQIVSVGIQADLSAYQKRTVEFNAGKKELVANLEEIDKCCQEFSNAVDGLVGHIVAYRDKVISQLQSWRSSLSIEIYHSIEEVEASLPYDSPNFDSKYSFALRNYQPGGLVCFNFKVDTSYVESCLGYLLITEYPEPKPAVAQPVEIVAKPLFVVTKEEKPIPKPTSVLYITDSTIRYLNTANCAWSASVFLSHPIDWDSATRYTTVDDDTVFCCGARK